MTALDYLFIFLSVISPITYVYKTIKGTVRPHRVTRLVIWVASVTGLIVTFDSLNVSGKLFGIVFFTRATLLMLIALKYGAGGKSRLDILCLVLGLIGVVASVLGSGVVGILFALIADIIAYIPAFIKTYRDPSSEEPVFFGIEVVAASIIAYSIGELSVDIVLPVWFALSGLFMIYLIYRKKLLALATKES